MTENKPPYVPPIFDLCIAYAKSPEPVKELMRITGGSINYLEHKDISENMIFIQEKGLIVAVVKIFPPGEEKVAGDVQ